MRKILVVVALAAACGGADDAPATGDRRSVATTPATPVAQADPAPQGTVHEVRMIGTQDGLFAYVPSSLRIRVGDRVRWINESMGPHNVAFHEDRIPRGAAQILAAALPARPARIGPLAGGLLFDDGETFEVSFAGMPTGTYEYYCTPHEMLGMTATLTIVP